jgi:predicted secreted protein
VTTIDLPFNEVVAHTIARARLSFSPRRFRAVMRSTVVADLIADLFWLIWIETSAPVRNLSTPSPGPVGVEE